MIGKPYDEGVATSVTSGPPIARPMRTFVLTALGGPDGGKTFEIDVRGGRVLLGQSPACTVRLSDPTVSRRHAAFDVVDGTLRLTDLGSTNGTFVNGVRAREVTLAGGETIRVGSDVFRLEPGDSGVEAAETETSFGQFVGASPEIRRLYPTMRRIAASDIPVVIEGETGTGKEVLAEAIHEQGPRASGPFVVFDCTTVAASLMEAALFGHERGAFTGAVASSPGLFEQADKGTLFIDEIGDLDLALQPKLLRAIERAEVRRIGGQRWTGVNVRVLAATRRDLDREVQAGRFRDDLFFRLAVGRIELPPLRNRKKDISLLATHFWKELGGNPDALTGDLLARLEDYEWPGNVRELRNAVARRIALGELPNPEKAGAASSAAGTGGANDPIQAIIDQELPFPIARDKVMALFEQRYVDEVLSRHGGNVTHAAHASGVGRRYFQTIRGRHKE
jgi:DNA-binding NtrC family response regulator